MSIKHIGETSVSDELPKHLSREDLNDLLMTIEPENRGDIEQAYWNDWVDDTVRRREEHQTRLLERLVELLEGQAHTPSRDVPAVGDWMNTDEVAAHLGVAVKTVRKSAERGELRGVKFPPGSRKGRWRFKREDIEQALRQKKPAGRPRKGTSAWS